MKIIEIRALSNGAHWNRDIDGTELPEGWAVIPEDMEIPKTFPFVDITVDDGMVTSMTPGIVPEPVVDLDALKAERVAQSKAALAEHLESHPLTWTDGNQYSVTAEKQSLLTSQIALYQTAASAGQPYTLRWNTTGGVCTEWTISDLSALALAIGAYVQPLVSYQQAKEVEIRACETAAALSAIEVDYETLA